MKRLLAVSFLASTLAMAHAAEYAPQEFDFSELGTVQSVRQVQVMDLLPNVLEHAVRPETVSELVIRSDEGREVILRDEAMQRFVAGERVRLEPSNRGPRLEHD